MPEQPGVSLWRLFHYGILALLVGVLGPIGFRHCRDPKVQRRLRDTPRKPRRASVPAPA